MVKPRVQENSKTPKEWKEGNMLRSLNEILNYVLSAEDGEIGRCKDFLFDDEFNGVKKVYLLD
jgi:hypothetical protein